MGEALRDAGHTVSAPLLPGHGTHPDDLNNVRWQEWLLTAENEYQRLNQKCEFVWAAGESMGGLLCLLLAAKHPELMGLLLYAPALSIRRLNSAYVMQYVMRHLPKQQSRDDMLWKGYNVYPLKGAVQLLKVQKETRRALAEVRQPTLAFFSEMDATVDRSASELLQKTIRSEDLDMEILKQSPHVILLGRDQHYVIERSLRFINERLPQ